MMRAITRWPSLFGLMPSPEYPWTPGLSALVKYLSLTAGIVPLSCGTWKSTYSKP